MQREEISVKKYSQSRTVKKFARVKKLIANYYRDNFSPDLLSRQLVSESRGLNQLINN